MSSNYTRFGFNRSNRKWGPVFARWAQSVAFSSAALVCGMASAQGPFRYYCPQECPPAVTAPSATAPAAPGTPTTPRSPATPANPANPAAPAQPMVDPMANMMMDAMAQPDAATLASDTGAAASPASAAPNMVGDSVNFPNAAFLSTGVGSGFAGLPVNRVFKMAENTSPLPTDRIFFNFNHNSSAMPNNNIADDTVDLQSYVLGFEKTFLCGQASLEVRLPFTTGYASTQSAVAATGAEGDVEFGNIQLAIKKLLWTDGCTSLAAGTTLTFPTGSDPRVVDGADFAQISNDVVHIAPYIGAVKNMDRWFTQFYVQVDFATSDYSFANSAGDTAQLTDYTWLFVDWSIGYWLYQNDCDCSQIAGIAPIFEVHYNKTIGTGATSDDTLVDLQKGDYSIVNLTGALHFQLRNCATLRFAGVAPVSDDQFYDAEFAVQYNRYF